MRTWRTALLPAAALALLALLLSAVLVERSARRDAASKLTSAQTANEHRIEVLEAQNASLARRLAVTEKKERGVAPLAAKVLHSVFTIETNDGSLGTAWAAWKAVDSTHLITADHVVKDSVDYGYRRVTIRRKNQSWQGYVEKTDSINDLAVIRVAGNIADPLWQTPDDSISPLPGDELLLVGSPYGLEGSVTTGVVSRVTYHEIQTDAAANPGNSGGPAVDKDGNVVGVLLSGGGENLNFAVPIQRVCVNLRRCAG